MGTICYNHSESRKIDLIVEKYLNKDADRMANSEDHDQTTHTLLNVAFSVRKVRQIVVCLNYRNKSCSSF